MFLSSYSNTSGSLGEREMLWEHELQEGVSTAFSIELFECFYLTIRLIAQDFYEVIVDEAEGRINYRLIEIESE